MKKTVAIICVRMGSGRLPGKVMKELRGIPLLKYTIDRVCLAKEIDDVIIATSVTPENNVIDDFCQKNSIPCFRGDENDVTSRMIGALEMAKANTAVMIYGDSPLVDPRLIEECLKEFKNGNWDWVGNDRKNTYPSGMFTEVFSVEAFIKSSEHNTDPLVREHGTLFLRTHPELYPQKNIEAPEPLSRPDVHLDVDSQEDFELCSKIIAHFTPRLDFSLAEILEFLDKNPQLRESNVHIERRWKQYQVS